jgi:hypothetical protein
MCLRQLTGDVKKLEEFGIARAVNVGRKANRRDGPSPFKGFSTSRRFYIETDYLTEVIFMRLV